MSRDLMLLATLHDKLDTEFAITFGVLRSDSLWRAVDNDVRVTQQRIQRTGDVEPSLAHRIDATLQRREEPESLPRRDPEPPIGRDISDADQFHVILARDRVSYTFTDDPIAV